tara:strand:- start:512 stop:979 length:468 start_codon:yes stop_codon:yes gene_type:complete
MVRMGVLSAVAGGGVNPLICAIRIELVFPDWDAGLDCINEPARGFEGITAVSGADTNPDSELSRLKGSNAMNSPRIEDVPFIERFFEDAFTFLESEGSVGFVCKRCHIAAEVVIAHPAFESDEAARVEAKQLLAEGRCIQFIVTELEARHSGNDE